MITVLDVLLLDPDEEAPFPFISSALWLSGSCHTSRVLEPLALHTAVTYQVVDMIREREHCTKWSKRATGHRTLSRVYEHTACNIFFLSENMTAKLRLKLS